MYVVGMKRNKAVAPSMQIRAHTYIVNDRDATYPTIPGFLTTSINVLSSISSEPNVLQSHMFPVEH